jgi:hypothetical protein
MKSISNIQINRDAKENEITTENMHLLKMAYPPLRWQAPGKDEQRSGPKGKKVFVACNA